MAGPDDDKRRDAEAVRVEEEAEEGLHERLDDPGAPIETGPIEKGRVDAGPTGTRKAGYRQPESGNRIMWIGGTAVVVIILVVLVGWVL